MRFGEAFPKSFNQGVACSSQARGVKSVFGLVFRVSDFGFFYKSKFGIENRYFYGNEQKRFI